MLFRGRFPAFLIISSLIPEGVTLAQKYLLPCSCGKTVPVETSQAGGEVRCDCGQVLKIPSLSNIKKLPLEGVANLSDGQQQIGETAPGLKKNDGPRRKINYSLLTAGLILTIVSGCALGYILLKTYPKAEDVLRKQTFFNHGDDKQIFRDSTPLSDEEIRIMQIKEEDIFFLPPIDSMMYWDMLKDGTMMSVNFQDNFQALVDAYHLRCIVGSILFAVSLGVLVSAFIFTSKKTVGIQRGVEWK